MGKQTARARCNKMFEQLLFLQCRMYKLLPMLRRKMRNDPAVYPAGAKFFWYIFFMFFTFLLFTFYGMMCVAMTPNQHIATIVSVAFYGVWNLFSGFIVPRTRMPIWWRWYYWACPVSWTLYGQDRIESGETVEPFLRNYFGFKHDFLGVVAFVMFAFTVLFAARN